MERGNENKDVPVLQQGIQRASALQKVAKIEDVNPPQPVLLPAMRKAALLVGLQSEGEVRLRAGDGACGG